MDIFDHLSNKSNNNNPKQDAMFEGSTLKRVYPHNVNNGVFVVPKYITRIHPLAFFGLQNLHTIVLHKDIVSIGPSAFKGCINLIKIEGLESAKDLFLMDGCESCENLEEITLPSRINQIAERAFKDCKRLTTINIPENCVDIKDYAFAGCENLQTIDIPENMENIEKFAFAGCKNLCLNFLDDGSKIYFSDLVREYRESLKDTMSDEEINFNNDEFGFSDEEDNLEDDEEETIEEKEQYFKDLNIKYKKITLFGKEFVFPSQRLAIAPGALSDIKEITVYNSELIDTILKSGYVGKVKIVNSKTGETILIDYKNIVEFQKQQFAIARKKFYDQFLIPSGGTTDWIDICNKNNYKNNGYSSTTIANIPLVSNSRIEIEELTQPKYNDYIYRNEQEEFCTCLTFYKKEKLEYSKYFPTDHPYYDEEPFTIYYPFGATFNESTLIHIGNALSLLIDKARNLSDTPENQKELELIKEKQKQLLDLLINGTKDKTAVAQILKDIQLPKPSNNILENKHIKDWLPYDSYSGLNKVDEIDHHNKTPEDNEYNQEK